MKPPRMDAIATTDALTGLPNRRAFDDQLAREIARATRHAEPLSLLMLDLDHFKQVNDTHGHPAGDRVLQQLAELLRGEARSSDHLARIGGEEFAWLLPHEAATDVVRVADRARAAVAAHDFGDGQHVTISIGIAQLDTTENAATLVARADAALYAAKANGRDRVVTG